MPIYFLEFVGDIRVLSQWAGVFVKYHHQEFWPIHEEEFLILYIHEVDSHSPMKIFAIISVLLDAPEIGCLFLLTMSFYFSWKKS